MASKIKTRGSILNTGLECKDSIRIDTTINLVLTEKTQKNNLSIVFIDLVSHDRPNDPIRLIDISSKQ